VKGLGHANGQNAAGEWAAYVDFSSTMGLSLNKVRWCLPRSPWDQFGHVLQKIRRGFNPVDLQNLDLIDPINGLLSFAADSFILEFA